ncbi:DUF4870 family protein [Alterisphingorhabdus coralli]|uniref:DUF4870 domain-containing protein n=1 Tax=Alterisphingorhabdus coralli TaxID=3071408 RepID=A0AA97F716_9SPHN|nr:hypothetical protein [Parasphingorhabdus sp. SCSIO 66989]WOE74646.1 hypothetical protein RB602_12435 [Parasphingorhabdus sp. SCSIO 66989]
MSENTPKSGGDFDLNQPTIISLLYLGSLLTGITSIIGVVLAFIWKSEAAGSWEESHFTYHIYTFVIGTIAGIVAFILSFVIIGIFLFPLILVWFIVRSVKPLLAAQKQQPMPDPKTLLF